LLDAGGMETSKQAEGKTQAVGAGRRKWSAEERDAIVRASLKKGTTVNSVAKLYGVNPSQIYDWRKQARQEAAQKEPAALIPVHVADDAAEIGAGSEQSCSVVIEAQSARITITGRVDGVVVQMILECLVR
jgi:transposase